MNAGFRHRTLEDAGWFDFVDEHRPETKSAVTMACHALTFLCIRGRVPNMRMDCAHAVLTFLRIEKGLLPTAPALVQLRDLLDEQPINEAHVHEWFHRNYP